MTTEQSRLAVENIVKLFPQVKKFLTAFGLRIPIIQSPMAGADNNTLACDVAESGGMGSRGMGYLPAARMQHEIQVLKAQTDYFTINLFIPDASMNNISSNNFKEKSGRLIEHLAPYYRQFELPLPSLFDTDLQQLFLEQIDIVLREKIQSLSITFGRLPKHLFTKLKAQGATITATATTLDEAMILDCEGYDAIVAQGLEAGGHRGSFSPRSLEGQMKTIPLVKTMRSSGIKTPIIAAGGVRDGKKFFECLSAGASAVQIGTGFLACENCTSIPKAYQKLLRAHLNDIIEITPAISGRNARGIQNKLFLTMKQYYNQYPESRLPYPVPHFITGPLRAAAAKKNDADWIATWSGCDSASLPTNTISAYIQRLLNDVADLCSKTSLC